MTEIPHFSQPFRFGGPQAAVSEQDSVDEVADCVLTVLVCPFGYRDELPEFGLPDPTFGGGVDVDEIREVVERWEPRAALLLEERPDLWDELVARVEIDVRVRTEE